MGGCVNKVILVGCLGRDPEVKVAADGKKIARFNLATSKRWKEKDGDLKESTTWHKVVVLNSGLAGVAEQFLHKGSRVYIEGEIGVRSYTGKDNVSRQAFEVIVPPFGMGALVLLDRREKQDAPDSDDYSDYGQSGSVAPEQLDDPPW